MAPSLLDVVRQVTAHERFMSIAVGTCIGLRLQFLVQCLLFNIQRLAREVSDCVGVVIMDVPRFC